MRPYRKINTANTDLNRVQDRVADALGPVLTNPLLNGVFIDVTFAGAETKAINHLLNRQPQGWLVTDNNANATFYRSSWNSRTISIVSSAEASIKLYVF